MPNTRIYWLHALSPTHAGIGRGVGYIDLPIDRDGVTGWPIIRGSAFKGVWADHHRATTDARRNNATLRAAFGIAGDDNNSNAGALIPTDAKLVCLPVRSFRGTFAWCTSPLCLQMLRRTLELAGVKELPSGPVRSLSEGECPSLREADVELVEGRQIYPRRPRLQRWKAAIRPRLGQQASQAGCFPAMTRGRSNSRSGSSFCRTPPSTSSARPAPKCIRACGSTTNQDGRERALWTEESLPAETILAGIVQCDRVFGRTAKTITPNAGCLIEFAKQPLTLQIGGKATVGRGQMRCVFTPVNGGDQ